ncbi:MAG: ion channel [bacterium]
MSAPDLGFGRTARRGHNPRLLNRDGTFNVQRAGVHLFERLHLYRWFMSLSWPGFIALASLAYLVSNTLFAFGFLACGPHALVRAPDSGLADGFLTAFFFSVETSATIGYGNVIPGNVPANLLMVVESFVSLLAIALITGLVFARFSQPRARIKMSRHALVAPFQSGTGLMVRVVNERDAPLVDLKAEINFVRTVETGGVARRTFSDLPLEYDQIALFPLSWTLVHPIDESSPLHGHTSASLLAADAEIIVVLSSTEAAMHQSVHARTSYRADEVVFGTKFVPMFEASGDGRRVILHVDRLDRTAPADGAPPPEGAPPGGATPAARNP